MRSLAELITNTKTKFSFNIFGFQTRTRPPHTYVRALSVSICIFVWRGFILCYLEKSVDSMSIIRTFWSDAYQSHPMRFKICVFLTLEISAQDFKAIGWFRCPSNSKVHPMPIGHKLESSWREM